jgi:hypothetical protein
MNFARVFPRTTPRLLSKAHPRVIATFRLASSSSSSNAKATKSNAPLLLALAGLAAGGYYWGTTQYPNAFGPSPVDYRKGKSLLLSFQKELYGSILSVSLSLCFLYLFQRNMKRSRVKLLCI